MRKHALLASVLTILAAWSTGCCCYPYRLQSPCRTCQFDCHPGESCGEAWGADAACDDCGSGACGTCHDRHDFGEGSLAANHPTACGGACGGGLWRPFHWGCRPHCERQDGCSSLWGWGCGKLYLTDYLTHPPACCEPCDACGNWHGSGGCGSGCDDCGGGSSCSSCGGGGGGGYHSESGCSSCGHGSMARAGSTSQEMIVEDESYQRARPTTVRTAARPRSTVVNQTSARSIERPATKTSLRPTGTRTTRQYPAVPPKTGQVRRASHDQAAAGASRHRTADDDATWAVKDAVRTR